MAQPILDQVPSSVDCERESGVVRLPEFRGYEIPAVRNGHDSVADHNASPKQPLKLRGDNLTTLQGVRGASALMVVGFHAVGLLPTSPWWLRYGFGWGYCGVDFFFVLSGFILLFVHYCHIDDPGILISYFSKRFSRIFPPYWAVLSLMLAICSLSNGIVSPEKKSVGYIVASVFLLPQWDPFLGVAWSLSCELFFYLMFALLLVNRRAFGIAAGLWLALVVENLVHPLPAPFDFLCQARVMEFLAGMCIAWGIREGMLFGRRIGTLVVGGGACVALTAGIAQIAQGSRCSTYPLWFGLSAVLIIAGLVSLEFRGLASAGRSWRLLGNASYSIYLVHYPILLVVTRMLSRKILLPLLWLLAVVLSITSGIVFHYFVEKPACKFCGIWMNKLVGI